MLFEKKKKRELPDLKTVFFYVFFVATFILAFLFCVFSCNSLHVVKRNVTLNM